MKRSRFSRVLTLGAAGGLLLAGCAGGGGTGGGGGDGDETVTLTYWSMLEYDADNPRSQAEKQIIDLFMEENPDIDVTVESYAWNELPRQTMLAVQGGGGPDVARVSFSQTLEYLDVGTLQPLDDFLEAGDEEDFLGEKAIFEGQRMGINFSPVPNGILYRTDLFEATGLPEPQTWDDLAEVLAAMTTDDVAGFAVGMQPGTTRLTEFLRPYVWGAGEDVFDEDWNATFDNQASVDAYQFLVDLIENGTMPEETLRLSNDDVLEGFASGQYAAVLEESSRASTAAAGAATEGKVGLWRFPSADGTGSPPVSFSWNIGMMSSTDHPEESWKLIQFMTGSEADRIKAEVSAELPSRASSDVAEYLSPIGVEFLEYLQDYPEATNVYVPDTQRFFDVAAQAMQNVFVSDMSVEDALSQAADEYDSAQ